MNNAVYGKDKLPVPVLKGREEWIALYDKTWEAIFENQQDMEKKGFLESCFMTLFTNYSNETVSALDNLDRLYVLRNEETGHIPRVSGHGGDIPCLEDKYISPPLLAWAEWQHYVVTGDTSRFERVLPALEGYYGYIEKNHRRNTGLYWFNDPIAAGMEGSPRGGAPAEFSDGSDVCHVDLACQQALSAKCLSKIYGVLEQEDKKEFYASEHKRICELINRYHWSERAGFYLDFFGRDEAEKRVKFINSKTAATFYTLLCGCAEGERLRKVIETLFDEDKFYTKVPFASLSQEDPNYEEKGGNWRGDVWACMNYVAIKGLLDCGYEDFAREAAIRFLSAMKKVDQNESYGGLWEAYAPESYEPSSHKEKGAVVTCRPQAAGWSALGPINLLIEGIIGIRFNAPKNTVTFRMYPGEIGGVRNVDFCGGKVSVECVEYSNQPQGVLIVVETEKPIILDIWTKYAYVERKIEVPAGRHEYRM